MISHGKDMKVFSGNANVGLAKSICKLIGIQLGSAEIGHFADGEVCASIYESVRGSDVFLVQSTSRPVNDNLMELLVMIDAMKRASAGRVTAVVPYFGYARQDRKAKARDPISAKLVANMLVAAGADRVLTLDLHAAQIQGFFDIPLDNLVGGPTLYNYFKPKVDENFVVVSPDIGSVARARKVAARMDAQMAIIDKRRPKANVMEVMNVVGDVKGKMCLMLDDMIDTAGTICKAAGILKEKGAKSVRAVAIHAVLSGKAYENIEKSALDEVVFTDSIPQRQESSKIKVISVADMFAETIRNVVEHKSISDHFIL